MQIKCLFTASDKDSIVTGAYKRQVKGNQFLIFTKMKYKGSVCLLSISHFKLHLSEKITSLQSLMAFTDIFVLGVLSVSHSDLNLLLFPSLYPPAPIQPTVCVHYAISHIETLQKRTKVPYRECSKMLYL